MKQLKFKIKTFDNLNLSAAEWNKKFSKAIICIIHGIGEHSSRYNHVIDYFLKHNYTVFTMDLRGHGKSEGKKGHTPSYSALMRDISSLIKTVKKNYPDKSIFLYGHSMGGNLVINYVIREQPYLSGVIASAPDLGLSFKPPLWKIISAKILNLLLPSLTLKTGIDNNALSRDKKIVHDYNNDPLVHDHITPRLYTSLRNAANWVYKHSNDLLIPILIMHGSEDKLTSSDASYSFFKKLQKDCTYRSWKGLYHELHNEPEKLKVLNYILKWLNQHL